MAETRIADVIVPEVFTEYTLEDSIYRSRLFNSGIMAVNPALTSLLNGGGTTFNLPFWQDVVGTTGDVPIEGTDQTVNAIGAEAQVARRQFRTKAWGSNDLAAVLAGSNPLNAAAERVNQFYAQAYDAIAIAQLNGVIADNVANDSGDLINDISGAAGAASNFTDDAVIDAQALLGENGVVGENAETDYVAILVEPKTYAYMRKLDLIDFVPISDQQRPLPFYMGMRVIVDRNLPVDPTGGGAGVPSYRAYIFKSGAIQWGVGSSEYLPTELDRNPLDGFGVDQLITRRAFAIHPVGFAWTETTVTGGVSPSDANLALAANWNRVFTKENSRFVALEYTLTAS
jgi:hypothetical protein